MPDAVKMCIIVVIFGLLVHAFPVRSPFFLAYGLWPMRSDRTEDDRGVHIYRVALDRREARFFFFVSSFSFFSRMKESDTRIETN